MKGFSGGGAGKNPKTPGNFVLRAFDPKTGNRVWEYPMTGPMEAWPGTVSTAGGLIFSADDDGHLISIDARTGQALWHFNMGETIATSPITYMVNGRQYVSIASATAVFSFGLFEPMRPTMPPTVRMVE